MGLRPANAAIEQGMSAIGMQLTSRDAVFIPQVGTFAVLHAEGPKGREVGNDAVGQTGCELVAQVFQGIVRLEIVLSGTTMLMQVSIGCRETRERLALFLLLSGSRRELSSHTGRENLRFVE